MVESRHGYGAEEHGRLTRMQATLNRVQLRGMNLVGVRSILDPGAGKLTRDLAHARVVLEASFAAPASLREHSAATAWYSLPLAEGTSA